MMNDDLMNFDLPQKRSSIIKVIGVGGGGGNAVNHMLRCGIKDVDFVLCNTDAQALNNSSVPVKIQLGTTLTEGRGSGNKPETGRQAAIENLDDILEILSNNTKMIFITAGMGGGTGTGAAPVIAKAAKELGILTVAIVTIPFRNEGRKRIDQAIEGIDELWKHVDSLLVVNNEKIREVYGDLKISEAFSRADDILAIAAKSIAEIITVSGYVNVDFADVETVMLQSGVALMGSALAEGPDRAMTAIKEALNSPLLSDNDIKGAKNILLNITSGIEEITMDEIGQITDYVQQAAGSNADLIWGTVRDESLGTNISVTVIATGFGANSIPELYLMQKQAEVPDKVMLDDIMPQETINDDPFEELQTAPFTQTTFEFTVKEKNTAHDFAVKETPIAVSEQEAKAPAPEKPKPIRHETRKKEAAISDNLIEELESKPAYMRKKIKLDNKKHSEGTNISRFSLKEEKERYTKLKSDNSYLHDNVD